MIKILAILFTLVSLPSQSQYYLCDTPLIIPAWSEGTGPYSWNVSNGQSGTSDRIDIYITSTGQYVIYLSEGNNGCVNKDILTFFVDTCQDWTIWIPNSVTLTGVNRLWNPQGYNISIDSFMVFNRWGEQIAQGKESWEPSQSPIQIPIDVYAFKLFFTIPGKVKMEKYGRITVIN